MSKRKCDCKRLAKRLDDVARVISDVDWTASPHATGLSDEEVEAIGFGALAALTISSIHLGGEGEEAAGRVRSLSPTRVADMIMYAGTTAHKDLVVDNEEDEPGDRDASGVRVAVEFRGQPWVCRAGAGSR